VLRASTKIKYLYLGGNHFDPAGGRAMAQLLVDNGALTRCAYPISPHHPNLAHPTRARPRLSLDISHLTDDGAASIATALRQNTTLNYLCLKYNGFTPRGVACLFDALQVRYALLSLCSHPDTGPQ
jgi:hypothetical protein